MEISSKLLVFNRCLMASGQINITIATWFTLDLLKRSFRQLDLFLMFGQERLSSVLAETALDHFFDFQRLHAQQV